MRISTSLQLAALCLIAIDAYQPAAQARDKNPPCLRCGLVGPRRVPIAEPKKPVIQEEFDGYGKTELLARNDALKQASEWLEKQGGLGWTPDAPYLLEHALVRFSEADEKVFDDPELGKMKVVKMQLGITADQARAIQKKAQQQRMEERQKSSLLVVLGMVGLLGVVGGYLRLEEATKGYYTHLLRIAAISILLVFFAGLYLVG